MATDLRLDSVYTNSIGQRIQPFHVHNKGGINERVHAHNFTTGYDEAWSTRLFLAEHELEPEVGAGPDLPGDDDEPFDETFERQELEDFEGNLDLDDIERI